jgi:hypothetical protein
MKKIDAAEFLSSQLLRRWPGWKPGSLEIQDWMAWIEKYAYETACKAAMEHARTTRFVKRPVTGDFFEICDRIHKEGLQQNPGKRKTMRLRKAYLICTETSPQSPQIRKGMEYVVMQESEDDDLLQRAEWHRDECQRRFGAKFRIHIPPD